MPTIHLIKQPSPVLPTLHFAANELQRILQRMTGETSPVIEHTQYQPNEPGLWLGTFENYPPLSPHLKITNGGKEDDEIHIAVDAGNGLIAGENPRSLLMAVYRYLAALGCRWVRQGADGEFIPKGDPATKSVHLHATPSYRHRAVCIEGAVSLENVLDMVDWLPKVGMSGYFMQFREGFTFFDRWYRHTGNPLKSPEPFSVEQARAFTAQMESELQKRGLIYHAIGHGWTCESYGVACLGWDRETGREWPAEFLSHVAEVNGVRSVPWDIPSIAALCYSDPEVQAKLAACVVDYAAAHPQIDLLHIWLDDGFNNKCECERCRAHLPADDYIQILNAIDAGLTHRGLPHKVVFLAYVDMLWPPETERLHNPDRFVFMFAPISRTYREEMKALEVTPPIPAFERNKLAFPKDVKTLLSFLKGWQTTFQGDSFVYDYHLIFSGLYQGDPGMMRLARLLHADMQNLKGLGLNGMVSCQIQRVSFPTGLAMYAMARALWDSSQSYEAIAQEYFTAAFGPDGEKAQSYLDRLADRLDLGWLADVPIPADAELRCKLALGAINRFIPTINRNLSNPDACQARSWRILQLHAQVVRRMIKILQAKIKHQADLVARNGQLLTQFVREHEDELQPFLDVWGFTSAYDRLTEVPHETA